jgi:hypothetical protein
MNSISDVVRTTALVKQFGLSMVALGVLVLGAGCSSERHSSGGGPAGISALSIENPETFYTSGPEGGPFPSGSRDYSITNTDGYGVRWELNLAAPWLNSSMDEGYLHPGQTQVVTISVDQSTAGNLGEGNYEASIAIINSDFPDGQTYMSFVLQVTNTTSGPLMAVSPVSDFETTGPIGGNLVPAAHVYTVANLGAGILTWEAVPTVDWIILDQYQGTVDPGQTTDITVTIGDHSAPAFSAGLHREFVSFTNTVDHNGDAERAVSMTLTPNVTPPNPGDRVTEGLVALYDFEEASGSIVHDRSGVSPALDLIIEDGAGTSWIPGALNVQDNSIIRSTGTAHKITSSALATSEITVEAWITPDNTSQDGPARIVSLSGGLNDRNFTLGQGTFGNAPTTTFDTRFRTSETDTNGVPSLTTPPGSAAAELQHVVYTRDSLGTSRTFVNGLQVSQTVIGGTLAGWEDFQLTLANEDDGSRPWLGLLHLVAIYDHALTPGEVGTNFTANTGDAEFGFLRVVTPGSYIASGDLGETFVPAASSFQLQNGGNEAITWSASASENWFSIVGSTSGTLQAGASHNVNIQINQTAAQALSPGQHIGEVAFTNTSNGFGSEDRDVRLTVYDPDAPSNGLTYFEKTNGSLDYMGVKITRTSAGQKTWAPGDGVQEYPGGWVTPGTYTVSLNPGRIHHKKNGTLTGQTRSGDVIMGVVQHRDLDFEGFEMHGLSDPGGYYPSNWGTSQTINLVPGDALHVAYGNVIVPFQKRNGSDGIIIYCVETEPEYRGGLWGLGRANWSHEIWNKMAQRVEEAAEMQTIHTAATYYGPSDGSLPNVFPADFSMSSSTPDDNYQSRELATWIRTRSIALMQQGDNWQGSHEDLDRLFQFYCNNIQTTYCWSDTPAQSFFYAHGPSRYPPYFIEQLLSVIMGAVALGYDPDYEPLHRLLTMMGQRADMTLSHVGSYTMANSPSGGGLAAHINDSGYTQWLWFEVGATNMQAKGSHRIAVWGPCIWAREMLGFPRTAATNQMLSSPGWSQPGGTENGHEWTESGAGVGWSHFYAGIETNGAMWLWFTGMEEQSQMSRWARRSYLYKRTSDPVTNRGKWWTSWVQAHYVGEPRNPSASPQGGGVQISWNGVTEAQHYSIYRSIGSGSLALLAGNVNGTSFLDTSAIGGTTYQYVIQGVSAGGQRGSYSDRVQIYQP